MIRRSILSLFVYWQRAFRILVHPCCTGICQVLAYSTGTGRCTFKYAKNKPAYLCPEFLIKQLFWHIWSAQWLSHWAAGTAEWTIGSWMKFGDAEEWVPALMMRLDSDGAPDKRFNHFFQDVCASLSLLAFIFKWKSFDAWLKNKLDGYKGRIKSHCECLNPGMSE